MSAAGILRLAVSVAAGDPLRLGEQLSALAEAGADSFYFPISDGAFAPGVQGGLPQLQAVAKAYDIPCEAHLMLAHPEAHVDACIGAGCPRVTVHIESGPHAHALVRRIRDAGASPGIAINPATPLTRLDYVVPEVDRVLVMAAEPGEETAPFLPVTIDRARILAGYLKHLRTGAEIQVLGGFGLDDAARLIRAGAHGLILSQELLFETHDPAAALVALRHELPIRAQRV
jgi:ribulose-phosphate 3-epimerase